MSSHTGADQITFASPIVFLLIVNILTLVTFVLAQGVKIQHGRTDNLDTAMCKTHKVDLGLLQLGEGQEHPE